MKIPKGMTQEQVVETINKVVNRYAHKFKFGYYEADDIRQEAFIIAMEALDRYDEERPLENFLSVHVKNRLSNFKRDKFFRYNGDNANERAERRNQTKKFLMEPINIEHVRDEHEKNMKSTDSFVSEVDMAELFTLIDLHLNISLRSDYLRLMHGVYVSKPRREQIYTAITDIFDQHKNGEIPWKKVDSLRVKYLT